MTNSKWLRSALLGGVAVSVMATGAQASELSDLKAQLEALQSRVNTIETAPRAAALPEGAMLMTASRGQGSNTWGAVSARDAANVSNDRGFTIAINPTADLPAPVTEITVYGYAKLDLSFGDETTRNHWFGLAGAHGALESNEWRASANQSRFGIRAKTDTAIGQIRANIEGDFSPGVFRLRHGYGEWDMTENWTLVAGQTWHTASLLPLGVSTVDFSGSAGPTYSRSPQLSLAYKSGPIQALIGVSSPQGNVVNASSDYIDLGGRIIYTAGGGHELFASASIGDHDFGSFGGRNSTSWQVGGGANIRLGEIASITAGAHYGKGAEIRRYLNQEGVAVLGAAINSNGGPVKMWGALVGVSISVSEATTFNVQAGYTDHAEGQGSSIGSVGAATCSGVRSALCMTDAMTVHANILWRPVRQMRLGWEVRWGQNDYYAAKTNSYTQGSFGAWFFF